jgi:hypothetical protein
MNLSRQSSISSTAPPPYTPARKSRVSGLFQDFRASMISLLPPAYERNDEPLRKDSAALTPNGAVLEPSARHGKGRPLPQTPVADIGTTIEAQHEKPILESFQTFPPEKRRSQMHREWEPLLVAPPHQSTSPQELSFSGSLTSSTGHIWAKLHLSDQSTLEDGPTYRTGSRICGELELDLPKRRLIQSIELAASICSRLCG